MGLTFASRRAGRLPSIRPRVSPVPGHIGEQCCQAGLPSTCRETRTYGYVTDVTIPENLSSFNLTTRMRQAPDVVQVGSYYYVYYSVSTFGVQNSAIGVARSSSMDVGTWTDLGSTGVASSTGMSYNAIDGNLVNDNGNYFLTFGSFWNGLQRVRMTPTQKNGDVYQVAFDPNDTAMEGPYVFKYGDYYYLFFSKGQCCGYDTSKPAAGKEYRIMVCRSTSAVGPFVDKAGTSCRSGGGTKVLESHDWVYGPGGQGVYQDPTYGPVSSIHRL